MRPVASTVVNAMSADPIVAVQQPFGRLRLQHHLDNVAGYDRVKVMSYAHPLRGDG